MSLNVEGQSFVIIAVPTYNEEPYLEGCIQSLIENAPPDMYQLIIADGGSRDRTLEIAHKLSKQYSNIRVIKNRRKLQSAAINLVATEGSVSSKVLIRADAHNIYPKDYVLTCCKVLQETEATSLVVPIRPIGISAIQRAIAAALLSPLGHGGATHRKETKSRFVDHGHHAAFDLDFFRKMGGYDETLSHNEDVDLDHRSARAGGKIWLCTELRVLQYPRRRFRDLCRQYFGYGWGRSITSRLYPESVKLRHFGACGIWILLAVSLLLSFTISAYFLVVPALYFGLCTFWGILAAFRQRDIAVTLMGPAAILMQLSWAAGFFSGALAGRKVRTIKEAS